LGEATSGPLDLGRVTLLATQGWLLAPISPPLIGGLLLLAFAFLVGADLLKIALTGLLGQSLHITKWRMKLVEQFT
jgi:hypothetical protein